MDICNHRQGGSVLGFPLSGTSNSYSVITHRLPSGGVMAMCTRCLKEWHPMNFTDKTPATSEWEYAICFESTNCMSESSQFAIPEQACHKQIEDWARNLVRLVEENTRHANRIFKLENENVLLKSQIPPMSKKFYERLKFALKILTGKLPR